MTERAIRDPDQIRLDAARKLRGVAVSDHFQAVLGCLLSEDWTAPPCRILSGGRRSGSKKNPVK